MIDMIIKEKKIGALYNKLYYHQDRLQIRKDLGDIYQLAKDILNNPNKYKDILTKLRSYEQD